MSSPPRASVTAIVAATLSNGIGKDGGLPWRLPGEMKYFQRVTVGSSSAPYSIPPNQQNGVIMGRKTWESIPPKFRPLPGRQNVVVSRQGVDLSGIDSASSSRSLSAAISSLRSSPSRPADDSPSSQDRKIFLIGGAQLYTEALTSTPPLVDRVLLTRITNEVECDTFLTDFTASPAHSSASAGKWRLASHQELEDYVGFDVKEGEVEEKGFSYRFEMWVWS